MSDDHVPEAAGRLIRRAPEATARIMFETVKHALAECGPDEQFELRQEIYEWALTRVPAHTDEPHTAYLVTLDQPVKDETGFSVLNLLRMVRGVIAVDPVPADHETHIARRQAQHRYHELLMEALADG